MNDFSITPFRGLHLILLLLTAAAALLIFLLLRGKPEARRSRLLIGACLFNLALFAGSFFEKPQSAKRPLRIQLQLFDLERIRKQKQKQMQPAKRRYR